MLFQACGTLREIKAQGAGTADRHRVADHERDLAAQDIGHLVAVVMQVERAGWLSGGNGFLEHHDAVAGRLHPAV